MKPGSSNTAKENAKNTRITLQVLQPEAGGKENLVGLSRTPLLDKKDLINVRESSEKRRIIKDAIENVQTKEKKKKKMNDKAVQTEVEEKTETITAKDLTTEEPPSEVYWKILAERRRVALDETLKENLVLHEKLELLEQEKETIRKMYDEAKEALELLKEVIAEEEDDDNGGEGSSQD